MAATTDKIVKLNGNVIQIRDDYYNFNVTIPVNEYDLVSSFLREKMGNTFAAENFTAAVFQIAASQNVTVQELLESLNTQNKLELTASIALYLNQLRKPTTLLGVTMFMPPNPYAARNVLV